MQHAARVVQVVAASWATSSSGQSGQRVADVARAEHAQHCLGGLVVKQACRALWDVLASLTVEPGTLHLQMKAEIRSSGGTTREACACLLFEALPHNMARNHSGLSTLNHSPVAHMTVRLSTLY